MKTALKLLLPLLVGSTSAAVAATRAAETGGNGFLIWFFIGFGVMVLLFQTAPAMMMFVSLLKGLFSTDPTRASFSPFKGKLDE